MPRDILPRGVPPIDAPSTDDRPADAAAERRVLIIDDNEDDIAFLTAGLRRTRRRLRIFTETDPKRGIGAAQSCDPELVFIDFRMPGMTGRDVVRRLRADRLHDRRALVVLSSSCDAETVASLYRERADDFYDKPHSHEGFHDLAGRVTARWLGAENASTGA